MFLLFTINSLFFHYFLIFNGVSSAKKPTSLENKVFNLVEWTKLKSVISFDLDKFKTYSKSSPRNYSLLLMLTALGSQRECEPCHKANKEFIIVANSWVQSPNLSPALFFGRVDFDDAPEVFQQLSLQSAPVFILFPAKGKPHPSDTMPMNQVGFSADAIAHFILTKTSIKIEIIHPIDYTMHIGVFCVVSLLAILFYYKSHWFQVMWHKSSWATIILFFIFTMTSGQMWNHIREAPMMHMNNKREVIYIHPYSDSQFIAETYIVFLLNLAVVIGLILISEASTFKTGPRIKKVMALCGLALTVLFFSILLSIFRTKNQGYPYYLFF